LVEFKKNQIGLNSKKKSNWIEFKKINLVNKKKVLFFERVWFRIEKYFT